MKRPNPHPCSWPTPLSTRSLKMEKERKEAVYLELESQVTEWRKEWFWKVWFARQPTDSSALGHKIIHEWKGSLPGVEGTKKWLIIGWLRFVLMDHFEEMRPSMCDMNSVPPTEANNWGEGQIQNSHLQLVHLSFGHILMSTSPPCLPPQKTKVFLSKFKS